MGLLAKRYAKAWLEYASEAKKSEVLYATVKTVLSQIEQNPSVENALLNPVVTQADKEIIVLELGGNSKEEVYTKFVHLLRTNNRLHEIRWIALQYLQLYRSANKIHEVKLSMTVPADAKTEKQFIGWMEKTLAGKIELKSEVSEELIGGFVMEIDGSRWDASLSTQLNNLRKGFLK